MKFFGLVILFLSVIILSAESARQFTATDLHKMERLSSPALSPDKKYVVFSVRVWSETSGKVSTHLEYSEIATGKTFNLTDPLSGYSDFSPIFNAYFPNIVTFLSSRSGSSQAWYLTFPPKNETDFGAPVQLTDYALDVENLKFKANSLVFSTEIFFDCYEDVLHCTAGRNAEIKARGANTWGNYTKLFVRHWDRWLTEGKGNHLILQSVTKETKDGVVVPKIESQPVDLMRGMMANSPVPPNGGAEHFDIKPDGSEVVFTAHLRTDDESWETGWKTYTMNVETRTSPILLTGDIKARTQNPLYTPDGTKISYLAMNRPGLESDNLHIEVYDSLTNKVTKITDFFDNSVLDYMWYDGNTILFTVTDINKNRLFLIDTTNPSDSITPLTEDAFSYVAPSIINYQNGLLLVQRSSWTTPDELATFSLDLKNRKISSIQRFLNINEEYLSNFSLEDCESFTFTGGNDDAVQGWILKPANFEKDKTYPLAFLIHGGPEGAWEASWSYRWNPQLWAHRGYAVVMINPHGSSGQGIKFQDAVRDDWGGVPYKDLMTGLDFALQIYKFIDRERMCALGASYGGYMVNWIQGQTDRFKCLVTHDGVFSTLSMFYATEEIWFPYAEYCPRNNLGCNPFNPEFRDHYLRFSPESYVQNWKTPHLIIHGSNDFRIPVSEGLSAFTALQVQGIKSKFLHFHEENHWVLRAENSIKWYTEVIGWLDKFTKPKPKKTLLDDKKVLSYLEQ